MPRVLAAFTGFWHVHCASASGRIYIPHNQPPCLGRQHGCASAVPVWNPERCRSYGHGCGRRNDAPDGGRSAL